VKKPSAMSPRSYLWSAGVLILVGTMLITFMYFEQATWYALHPPPSGWYTIFDQSFHGELSASNTSINIPLEADNRLEKLEFQEMYTNNTPITITIQNSNNETTFQLVNITAPQINGPYSVEIIGGLASLHTLTATVTITRETDDVQFRLRIIGKTFFAVSPAPPPYYLFISGYIIGSVLIILGFRILEQTTRRMYYD
jgi:hypothetical protein